MSALPPTFLSRGAAHASPVLMLHGIGSTAAGWAPQLVALGATHHAIAWNAPGYADSPPLPDDSPTVADYAAVVLAWMDSLHIRQGALVASSWGGLIALAFAAAHPDRVTRLVLSGPTAGAGHLPAEERSTMLRARGDRARQTGIAPMLAQDVAKLVAHNAGEALRERIRQAQHGVTLGGYLQAMHALVQADGVQLIGQVRCPVLVVAGDDDLIAPPAQHALRLAQAAPHSQLVRVARCGHLPHAEHPDTFILEVLGFIDAGTHSTQAPKETSR
ncbi:alpha/beta fold hydrolase [Variovorax sp. VNK109]|uniref:alpha/beta fold hydrolase n=1 Tax=Variovorax sp. VNK109 TaxID=3400919 RepID=UPI003BFE151D